MGGYTLCAAETNELHRFLASSPILNVVHAIGCMVSERPPHELPKNCPFGNGFGCLTP